MPAAIVTPYEQKAVWEDGRIITYTQAHVDTLVAGSVAGAAVTGALTPDQETTA